RAALRRRATEQRTAAQLPLPVAAEIPTDLVEPSDALDALTPRRRARVTLRYFADRPDTEIASLLDCRPSRVRSLARRALVTPREESR
ncbi:MAG: sigma factor-like helix-turn-helix DNA-binding protein, partial [Acidimicrobiales bacterium]